MIPQKILASSEELVKDIDIGDTPHVALTKFLKVKLWTGDLQLFHGLKAKKFKDLILTEELANLYDILERK